MTGMNNHAEQVREVTPSGESNPLIALQALFERAHTHGWTPDLLDEAVDTYGGDFLLRQAVLSGLRADALVLAAHANLRTVRQLSEKLLQNGWHDVLRTALVPD